MMGLRVLAILYCLLLAVDGVLSIIDNAGPVRDHHYSTWTSISLVLVSIPVLIVGLLLGFVFRWKPKWPLLVSSGTYSVMIIAILIMALATAIAKGPEALANLSKVGRGGNLEVGFLQVVIGGLCLFGAFQRESKSEPDRPARKLTPPRSAALS
jgi:uncharacterized membrane protein HdeD (DUF308 family)